jgi:hypothetical protein
LSVCSLQEHQAAFRADIAALDASEATTEGAA